MALTCGDNGSTGQQVITQINTNTEDIISNGIRLAVLENTGMTVLSGNNLPQQTIEITPTKVTSFDVVTIDAGVGTSGDVVLQRMTADADGIFKLRYEGFVSYATNITITWQIYKNGSPFGSSIALAGQGAGYFPIVLISSAELVEGAYLELYATASAATDLDISQSNGTLEKTYFV